jgi:hypothetical protein
MSIYRQVYTIPFTSDVQAPEQSSPLDDQFITGSVQLVVSGIPVPGYTELATKWQRWDPGSVIALGALDAAKQMGYIRTNPVVKAWAGYLQAIPIPTLDGEIKQIALYTRTLFGGVSAVPGEGFTTSSFSFGLLLGQELLTAPAVSPFRALCTTVQSFGNAVTASAELVDLASYDGVTAQLARAEEAGMFPWQRIRLSQQRVAADSYTIAMVAEVSATGIDWLPMYSESVSDLAEGDLYRCAGFGIAQPEGGTAYQPAMYVDAFAAVEQAITSQSSPLGTTQSLGSV